MRNKLFVVFICLFSISAFAVCDHPVNPKKMVLFIDTNNGGAEVDAAAKAACERGESFMSIPSFARGGDHRVAIPAVINQDVRNLAARNVAITSLVISGHDGGGYTMGPNGYIKKEDVITIMKNAYSSRPALLSELHSVLMWGCYSATPEEVLDWKTALPNLKIVAGFYGSAPSSAYVLDRTILHDLLVRGSTLSEVTDQNRLQSAIRNITNFGQTSASIYVEANCEPNGVLYSQTDTGKKYQRLQDALRCTANDMKKLDHYREVVKSYFNGSKAIPGWTDHSELRDAYSYARQLEHCLRDSEFYLNPDRVGHLLFWNGIRKNFNENFSREMAAGQNVLNHLRINKTPTANMKDFARLLQEAKTHVGPDGISNMYNLNREQIALNLARLSPLMNHPALREDAHLRQLMQPLIHSYLYADRYLHRLSPECMDFLPWHEYTPGHPPLARCHPH
ncbi:MAG: hypothetical protein ACJ76H_14325 [Bacteriovoracaceae bacterium]